MVEVLAHCAGHVSHHVHAERASSSTGAGYANYIGRVGALAVAVGIGTAIATSPGMAWATPDGDQSTTSSSAADTTNTSNTTNSSADSPLSSSSPPSPTASGFDDAHRHTADDVAVRETVTDTTGPDVTIRTSGGAETTDNGLFGAAQRPNPLATAPRRNF